MLRASYHLPFLKLSPTFLCTLKLPSSCFLSYPSQLNPSSLSSRTPIPISHSSPHTRIKRTLSNGGISRSNGGISRSNGRAYCTTAGNNGQGVGREILVQHLLIKGDDLKLLSELQKRIAKGEDLSDLAVEYSLCPSKKQGGMLGWVPKGQMVPEFDKAAFSAPLNKVVRCKTEFGWHLLQVLSEREEAVVQDIEPEELHLKMQDPSFIEDAQLIDVREPEEIAQASLAGFKVFPLRQFGSWAPEIKTKLDPGKDTYVLCHHGMRSLQVAKWLQSQGFKRIYNIFGGIHAYAVKVDPSVPTY